MQFVPREVKATFGIPCTEGVDGRLWVGKGNFGLERATRRAACCLRVSFPNSRMTFRE